MHTITDISAYHIKHFVLDYKVSGGIGETEVMAKINYVIMDQL